ncbi:MAG: hypothetical protein ACUVUG_08685 [Candidatus Aminicenantia bacterium]
MEKGISLTETIISLTLSLFVLFSSSIFVSSIKKEILKGKEQIESLQELYSAIDRISYEIKRCGIGLSKEWEMDEFKIFEIYNERINLRRFDEDSLIKEECSKGEKNIQVEEPFKFKEGREIIITDFLNFDFNEISEIKNDEIILKDYLKNDYEEGSKIIQINFVSLKFDKSKKILRMSQNSGPFQPIVENVEDINFKIVDSSIISEIVFQKRKFLFKFFIPFGGEI